MKMKKWMYWLIIGCLLLAMVGCGQTKILHCDHCQTEVTVAEDSNMEEDWTVYCEECNEKLFGDDPLLGAN